MMGSMNTRALGISPKYCSTPRRLTKLAALREADPEIFHIIQLEKRRQISSLELIASENFASPAVMEAVGSCMMNKYSEGLPGKRYYGCNQYIDQCERLCQQRALEAFELDPTKWGVNVQPLSGTPANTAVYLALLQPHERLMGLGLPDGGHLSHGSVVRGRKLSASSVYYEPMAYHLDEATGLLDYDNLEKSAAVFRPKLLVTGASAYPRDFDYPRLRKLADNIGAFFMMDMAHTSGLVAAGLVSNPFEHVDVVTTTTHKTLGGPRGAMIFFRKGPVLGLQLEKAINSAVFPGLQGGPHNHTIAGIAVCLKAAASKEFKVRAKQMVANSQALGKKLLDLGYTLVSGGTDNHLVLVDLKPLEIDGRRVAEVLEAASIAVNMNMVAGDENTGRGVRLGTSAMTTRGFKEDDFILTAELVHEGVQICRDLKHQVGGQLADFMQALYSENCPVRDRIQNLQARVQALVAGLPFPGEGLI